MKSAHLEYFKSLLEGTAEISWNAWFSAHEEELKAELPRAAFLRLKFKKLEEAENSLREANIEYQIDPVAYRREKRYSLFHESVLDDKGRPLESFLRKAYDGANGCLMEGDIEAGREILEKWIKKIRRYPVERRQEELESLCFDGEMELESGNPAIGRVFLEAVVSFPKGNDLTDFAVERAEELLQASRS